MSPDRNRSQAQGEYSVKMPPSKIAWAEEGKRYQKKECQNFEDQRELSCHVTEALHAAHPESNEQVRLEERRNFSRKLDELALDPNSAALKSDVSISLVSGAGGQYKSNADVQCIPRNKDKGRKSRRQCEAESGETGDSLGEGKLGNSGKKDGLNMGNLRVDSLDVQEERNRGTNLPRCLKRRRGSIESSQTSEIGTPQQSVNQLGTPQPGAHLVAGRKMNRSFGLGLARSSTSPVIPTLGITTLIVGTRAFECRPEVRPLELCATSSSFLVDVKTDAEDGKSCVRWAIVDMPGEESRWVPIVPTSEESNHLGLFEIMLKDIAKCWLFTSQQDGLMFLFLVPGSTSANLFEDMSAASKYYEMSTSKGGDWPNECLPQHLICLQLDIRAPTQSRWPNISIRETEEDLCEPHRSMDGRKDYCGSNSNPERAKDAIWRDLKKLLDASTISVRALEHMDAQRITCEVFGKAAKARPSQDPYSLELFRMPVLEFSVASGSVLGQGYFAQRSFRAGRNQESFAWGERIISYRFTREPLKIRCADDGGGMEGRHHQVALIIEKRVLDPGQSDASWQREVILWQKDICRIEHSDPAVCCLLNIFLKPNTPSFEGLASLNEAESENGRYRVSLHSGQVILRMAVDPAPGKCEEGVQSRELDLGGGGNVSPKGALPKWDWDSDRTNRERFCWLVAELARCLDGKGGDTEEKGARKEGERHAPKVTRMDGSRTRDLLDLLSLCR
ncbi:hypothetical protein IE53DRAFT_370238 [Violaceomyces palustris]|uniref:Uncharacterized protein n=1 Tax=Violaceomyces palustris TaxID=1673888 RepID=A0ACD0NSV0_9BASI|nr:hypothetical protein IE53DRAFT_370238 [Violaceomyces palustris]